MYVFFNWLSTVFSLNPFPNMETNKILEMLQYCTLMLSSINQSV